MSTEQKTLLTMSELADYFKCTERHIQNLMGRGLPYLRISKRLVRFDLGHVNAWIETSSVNDSAQAVANG